MLSAFLLLVRLCSGLINWEVSVAEELMGLADAAARLRVPYPTAHRLLLIGRLRGQKHGGRWMVPRSDVMSLERELGAERQRALEATAVA